MDEEIRWKEQLHANWTTPDEVISRFVLSASGSAVSTRSRIIGGEANEVWSITTLSGDDLILRVSRANTFAAEQWAAEQARRMGVPVPEILLVNNAVSIDYKGGAGGTGGTGGTGEIQVAIWIHRTIHGQPLWTVQNEQTARRLTAGAGEILARIHAVTMSGNGPIDAPGRGRFDDFSAYLRWDEKASDAALLNGISRADLDHAAELLEMYRHAWAAPPRLLHGDWLPEHILVHDDAEAGIAGIIDFGNTRSGDPAYDIAYWQFFWDTDLYPTSALLDGYRRTGDAGQFLDLHIHLCRLSLSMRAISYYTDGGRAFPAQHAARRFNEALEGLRAMSS